MPYYSSEIRWFSEERDVLWQIYSRLTPGGDGIHEEDRTDFYLRTSLLDTGVKVRKGRHEIKVKFAPDQKWDHGIIQHWVKWSGEEGPDILDTVPVPMLTEWTAVEKQRYQKRYLIASDFSLEYAGSQLIDEGCGVEFTAVRVPEAGVVAYTLGYEACSATGKTYENLLAALQGLKVNHNLLGGLKSMSYPQFLAGV